MDIDRAFLKELHSLKDRVSDSMLVGMINHGSESLKSNPDYPKNFGNYQIVSLIFLRFVKLHPLIVIDHSFKIVFL